MATRFAASTGRSGGFVLMKQSSCSTRTQKLSPESFAIRTTYCWPMISSQAPKNGYPTAETTRLLCRKLLLSTTLSSSGVRSPGTYLGFIDKIPQLKRLGINAVEFLPIHEFYVDDFLAKKGLTNYWGYNSIGFFTPESSYSTRRT